MFAQVSTQCLFTCATNILGERKWDLICHIWMLLISYHPCMVGFVWIIYLVGDMCVRDQYDPFNIRFRNVFHNLFFYKPTCVVCYTIHNGGHYLLEHPYMFLLLEFYTIYKSMFVIFSCHNFLNLLIVFCHPLLPWLCFLYDPSPISVPKALFICCLSKFFLQALTHLPFLSPSHVFWTNIANSYISLLDFYDKGHLGLWIMHDQGIL